MTLLPLGPIWLLELQPLCLLLFRMKEEGIKKGTSSSIRDSKQMLYTPLLLLSHRPEISHRASFHLGSLVPNLWWQGALFLNTAEISERAKFNFWLSVLFSSPATGDLSKWLSDSSLINFSWLGTWHFSLQMFKKDMFHFLKKMLQLFLCHSGYTVHLVNGWLNTF